MLRLIGIRLLPLLLLIVAAATWFNHVQGGGAFVLRNLVPLLVLLLLGLLSLWRGQGRWTGSGWRFALGTLGYAIPALGLSL